MIPTQSERITGPYCKAASPLSTKVFASPVGAPVSSRTGEASGAYAEKSAGISMRSRRQHWLTCVNVPTSVLARHHHEKFALPGTPDRRERRRVTALIPEPSFKRVEIVLADELRHFIFSLLIGNGRLSQALGRGGEQFERAAAGGGRDALARVAAWVAHRGHWRCLRDDDLEVEPRRSHCHRTA